MSTSDACRTAERSRFCLASSNASCKFSTVSRVYCKADYYSDPIPSFGFWSGRKNKYHLCEIETGFLCGDGARVIRFFARVIQQLSFWTQKIQANVKYCYVRRLAECTSLGSGLKHPSLRSDSSLAAKRRAEALPVFFFQPSIRAQHESCCCLYSRMIRSHERRALGALLSLFSRSAPAPTDS